MTTRSRSVSLQPAQINKDRPTRSRTLPATLAVNNNNDIAQKNTAGSRQEHNRGRRSTNQQDRRSTVTTTTRSVSRNLRDDHPIERDPAPTNVHQAEQPSQQVNLMPSTQYLRMILTMKKTTKLLLCQFSNELMISKTKHPNLSRTSRLCLHPT